MTDDTQATERLGADAVPAGQLAEKPSLLDSLPTESGTSVSIETPKEAMELQEVRRMRTMLTYIACNWMAAFFLLPLLDGDWTATVLLCISCLANVAAALGLLLIIRDETRYRPWMGTIFYLVTGLAMGSTYYFCGVTSFVVMAIPIGSYQLALGESYGGALLCHLNVHGSYLILTVLQLTDVIPNVGLIDTVEQNPVQQLGILMVVQLVMVAAFKMGRANRKVTLETLEQLDEAVASNARREALLLEAKQELALAHKIGGPGRFTEQTIGSFKLGNIIGRGAMGEVYEAVHQASGELAAVKLLSSAAMRDPETVTRFLREVQIARTLQIESIVQVLEVSESDSEFPYLAMERLHGETLGERLREQPRLPVKEGIALLGALAKATDAAHKAGIIHRDLKPSNIFHHEQGKSRVWKVLDFGVSKFMDQGDTLTAGQVIGTPAYMAPEQAQAGEVCTQTDIYALGVIAYRVFTGRPAFTGKDLPGILHAVVYDSPPRPSDTVDLPADFDPVLAIAMAKDAKDRFESAAELAEAFAAAGAGKLSNTLKERGQRLMQQQPWAA